MGLIDKLEEFVKNKRTGFDGGEDLTIYEVLELLYTLEGGDLSKMILSIDRLNKIQTGKEMQIMRFGVDAGMSNMYSLCSKLLLDNSKEAKKQAEYYFRNEDGNIASLIDIAKARFTTGTPKNYSISGQWWFNEFRNLLVQNKDKYLPGGSSYNWVVDFGHEEYINLVLSNIKDDV